MTIIIDQGLYWNYYFRSHLLTKISTFTITFWVRSVAPFQKQTSHLGTETCVLRYTSGQKRQHWWWQTDDWIFRWLPRYGNPEGRSTVGPREWSQALPHESAQGISHQWCQNFSLAVHKWLTYRLPGGMWWWIFDLCPPASWCPGGRWQNWWYLCSIFVTIFNTDYLLHISYFVKCWSYILKE